MNWEKIWNNREHDPNDKLAYNGYKMEDLHQFNTFIDQITKKLVIKDNSVILDLGCGNGYLINYLLEKKGVKNCQVYGIDYCKKNIQYAQNNFSSINFILGDIKNTLPFESNYFDYIISISTLFYLKDNNELNNLFKEIQRVSKIKSNIFIGNISDLDKLDIADKIRSETHPHYNSEHLYISKKHISSFFSDYNIEFIDNDELSIEFYPGYQYKFSCIITEKKINIGVDFHDTLSYNPLFFKRLFSGWSGKKVIITGTPKSKHELVVSQLKAINFYPNIDYDLIEYGYEYEKEDMDYSHFGKMKLHKLKSIKKHDISIYYDDNPYYVNYLKDFGICVFQTILSNDYITEFEKRDKYFCCNLQKYQFNYLEKYSDHENKKIYLPGVFDLFHVGHLKLIKKVKVLDPNSKLIIGVQSDISVLKSKNKRPVITLDERVDFIQNLDIANEVISYSDINQIDILKKYNIDKFVIGPEYGSNIDHKKTLEYCRQNQIEIIKIDRTPNISSTEIKERVTGNSLSSEINS